MDQETREAVTSLAADLKQHVNERHDELVGRFDAVNERHDELVGRFDAVDDRLKRVETSVGLLGKPRKGAQQAEGRRVNSRKPQNGRQGARRLVNNCKGVIPHYCPPPPRFRRSRGGPLRSAATQAGRRSAHRLNRKTLRQGLRRRRMPPLTYSKICVAIQG